VRRGNEGGGGGGGRGGGNGDCLFCVRICT